MMNQQHLKTVTRYPGILLRPQFVLLLLLLFTGFCTRAQEFHWGKGLPNTHLQGGKVAGQAIKVDAAGNTYVAGQFTGYSDLNGGPGEAIFTSTNQQPTIFLSKYDASGNYIYSKVFAGGGFAGNVVNNMVLDANNNVYLVGGFVGTIDFDPGPAELNLTSANTSSTDIFLVKLDADGNLVYAKTIGSTGADMAYGVAVDGNQHAYITGIFYGTVDFDPEGADMSVSAGSTTNSEIFLARYDASGNGVYAKATQDVSGSTIAYAAHDIAVDGNDNVYLTGDYCGTVDFDFGPGQVNLTSATTSTNMFFAKYDATGGLVYARSIGNNGTDISYCLAVDDLENVYIGGNYFGYGVDFDPGAGTAYLSANGNQDLFFAKYDANGNYVWAKGVGGSSADDVVRDIAVDDSYNVYIGGYFFGYSGGPADFDPGPGTVNLTSTGSYRDAFVARYAPDGTYIYAKSIQGPSEENIYSIALDGAGHVYFTGNFNSTIDADPGAGVVNLSAPPNTSNGFFGKYDANGDYTWAFAIGGYNINQSNEYGRSVAADASGNVYITGAFEGTVDFDPGAGVTTLSSEGGTQDMFIAKYSSAGNLIFAKSIGSLATEAAMNMAVDGSGNIYIMGNFNGSAVDFDPGPGVAPLTSANTPGDMFPTNDIFFAKYDTDGNYVFAKSLEGASYQTGQYIAVDALGYIYLGGNMQGTVDFDPGIDVANVTVPSGQDLFLAKYDADGNYVWAGTMGGSSYETLNGLTVDDDGNVYAVGSFSSSLDVDLGSGATALAAVGTGSNAFFAKYNASGNNVYAKAIGSTSNQTAYGYGIAVENDGQKVYITGTFAGYTVDFDPGSGTVTLPSSNSNNMFIAGYDANGNYLFAKGTTGGFSGSIQVTGLAKDSYGNLYVGGSFYGSGFDFDPGSLYISPTSNGTDTYIAKYDISGNFVSMRVIGGSGDQYPSAIAVAGRDVYVTGYAGNVDFDVTSTSDALYSGINGYDIFFAKYSEFASLPIKLTSFTAQVVNKTTVNTVWITASQQNNQYFEVQKSKNGINFAAAGQVDGCGTCYMEKRYTWVDPFPYSGKSWYRLRQVDADGSDSYSKIVPVNLGLPDGISLSAYPNPTSGMLWLQITGNNKDRQVVVEIRNAAGSLASQIRTIIKADNNQIPVNLGALPAGMYFIKILDAGNMVGPVVNVIKK